MARRCLPAALALGAALLLVPRDAAAQVTDGRIHGVVTAAATGEPLALARVTVDGPTLLQPLTAVTSASGRYEFPIVPIGRYTVSIVLDGFRSERRPGIVIETGFQAEVNAALELRSVEDTVEVSADAPIVDTRSTRIGATFSRAMLDRIPTARDPWQIVMLAAGVETSEFNVGGRRSGVQLPFTSRGQGSGDTMWNVEGATITDMAVPGSSPTYYDFDAFEEIQVTTGAADAAIQTSGININLVTRTGSDIFKGTGRIVYSDDHMQWQNVNRELYELGAGAGAPLKFYREWGGEAGGPIVRNRAWWWFGAARQDINSTFVGFYDTGRPECAPPPEGFEHVKANEGCLKSNLSYIYNYNGKLNYQLDAAHRFQFLYTYGNKTQPIQSLSPRLAPESLNYFTSIGPGSLNLKHTWVPAGMVVFDTRIQHSGGGLSISGQPGTEGRQPLVIRETGFVSRGKSGPTVRSERPTTEAKTDGTAFAPAWLGGDHAITFGIRYRRTPVRQTSAFTGAAEARMSTRFHPDNPRPGFVNLNGPLSPDRAVVFRDGDLNLRLFTASLYVQDSYTRHRLRVNVGVRWDYQDDSAGPGCVPASPILPVLLPAQCFDGADPDVTFKDLAPRLSASYDVFGTGRTVFKGGYALYFSQGVSLAAPLNLLGQVPLIFQNSTALTCWSDANGDTVVSADELNASDAACVIYPANFDAQAALRTTTANEIDPDLRNQRTREVTVSVDHALRPDVAVGVAYVHRRYDRFRSSERIGETPDMWLARAWSDADAIAAGVEPPSQFGLPSTGWVYYEFDPALVRPPAITRTQNIAEERRYDGLDLTVRKRFDDRWMLNAALTWQRTVTDPEFCLDCTNVDTRLGRNTGTPWLVKLNGGYALPRGWWASANLQVYTGEDRRLSFAGPPRRSGGLNPNTGNPTTMAGVAFVAHPVGSVREPARHMLDAQVEKTFLLGGRNQLRLRATVFNVFNVNTSRQRINDLNSTRFGDVISIQPPRILRVQVTVGF